MANVLVKVNVTSSTPTSGENKNTVGIAGIIKKPLADFSVIKVKSFDEAKAKLGAYMAESTIMYGLEKLFKRVGMLDIYISPVTHRTDVANSSTEVGKASTINITNATTPLIDVDATFIGVDGNNYAIRISNVNATTHTYDVEVLYKNVVQGKKIIGVTNTTFASKVLLSDLVFTPLVNVDTPTPDVNTYQLAGGVDGHTGVVSADYDTALNKLANKPLDYILVDSTLVSNQQTAVSIAEQLNAEAFINTPYGTTDDGALTHRANFNSSNGQLFHPHQWESDPLGTKNKPNRAIPIAYEALADYINAHKTIGRRQVGAGIEFGQLTGLGLTADVNGDTLSDTGVNYAITFENEGTFIWDSMTLSNDPDWDSANRIHLFNYVKKTLVPLLRPDLFKASDDTLWKNITTRLTMPMRNLFKAGELYSEDGNETGAYYVQCDGTNNPREEQLAKRTHVKVGYKDKQTIKWIVLDMEIS